MPNADVSFAIALPPDWQQIDLLTGDAEQVLDERLAAALAGAARGTDRARLLMMRSLFAGTPAGEPLSAGLSVALADPSAPVATAPLAPESFDGADVAAISLALGSGIRVRRVAPASLLTGAAPVQVLRVQYLVHTAHGLLTITFTTAQAPHAAEWEALFDAMAATSQLT